ncbi:MAG TPA: mechanosensitive ion channel domain-containing protein [Vicinamibacterales bacterium]|nr:mechanosensitive ion channel domain-containing protein [Vicinamibacterales bacterium]
MENLLSAERFLALWNTAYQWVLANVFVIDNAVQLGLVALTFAVAALLSRQLLPRLERLRTHVSIGRGVQLLTPLMLSGVWLLLLWFAISVATTMGRARGLMSTTATLLGAWIAIYLASRLVKNPLWSKLIAWAAWSIAALSIVGLLEPTIAVLDSAAIQVGQLRISLYTAAKSALALAILVSAALYAAGLIESRLRASGALSPSVQVLFTKSLKIVLVVLAVLFAIRSVGIDLTALAVFGGAIGLGIGFGFQKTVSNLISGVILLIDKSIKPGDVIAVAGTYGWVTTLGGRYVSVVTRDGVEHLIPNETLISEPVENWTHTHSRTRLKLDVGVHHGSDLKQVIAICEEAAREETERVLKEPEPKCLFIEFGESALKLQLRFWIADAHNGVQNVKSAVLLRIWEKFKQHDVQVPYPQRDLHIRSSAVVPGPSVSVAQPRLA